MADDCQRFVTRDGEMVALGAAICIRSRLRLQVGPRAVLRKAVAMATALPVHKGDGKF